jgi:cytochrome P450
MVKSQLPIQPSHAADPDNYDSQARTPKRHLWLVEEATMLLPPADQHLNPYPYYASMRREQPVAYDPADDTYAVFRHDDVRLVLKDFTRFSSDPRRLAQPIPGDLDRPSLIRMDPPDHRRVRSLVAPFFAPAHIARLTSTITRLAHGLIDAVAPTRQMDVIEDLAFPLPVTVIAELLGIPPTDRPMYKRWADMLLGRRRLIRITEGPPEEALQAQREMDAYFGEVIHQRRRRPQEDLISQWVAFGASGGVSDAEILNLCSLMLLAGHVTTVNLIGNALWTLLEWPDALARLRRDPALLPAALEEVLRYRAPVQAISRITTEDVTIGGQSIPAGRLVTGWIGSANRDEAAFPAPDRFNVMRNPSTHIAFGTGIHVCLGAPLARLEGQVVLRVLLERLEAFDWAPDAGLQASKQVVLFGLAYLPIRFELAQPVAA